MGYEALFIARIHYKEHRARATNKELEFVWQPDGQASDNHTNQNNDGSQIFTHLLYKHYSAPRDFDYISNSGKQYTNVIVGDQNSKLYNADRSARKFKSYLQKVEKSYMNTGNLLVMMGDDFGYENALYVYYNID